MPERREQVKPSFRAVVCGARTDGAEGARAAAHARGQKVVARRNRQAEPTVQEQPIELGNQLMA